MKVGKNGIVKVPVKKNSDIGTFILWLKKEKIKRNLCENLI